MALTLHNTNSFLSSAAYEFEWRILLNGAPLCVGGAGDWTAVAVPDLGARVRWSCGERSGEGAHRRMLGQGVQSKDAEEGGMRRTNWPLTLSPSPLQETADIALPVDLAAVRTAAVDALKGQAVGRTPEVVVELRAKVAAQAAWCEKVRVGCDTMVVQGWSGRVRFGAHARSWAAEDQIGAPPQLCGE